MSIAVFPGGLRRPLLVFDSVTARRCTSIPLDPALSSFDLEERPGPDAAADSGRKRGGKHAHFRLNAGQTRDPRDSIPLCQLHTGNGVADAA